MPFGLSGFIWALVLVQFQFQLQLQLRQQALLKRFQSATPEYL